MRAVRGDLIPRALIMAMSVLVVTSLFGVTTAVAATIAVTSTADSGPGTFRAAVATAGEGDTIDLPAGTITLTSGVISTAGKALTIVGTGARQTILDGNHASQILNTSKALTVTGVTFTDGSANFGGAIQTKAPLTLSDDAFVNNHATTGGGGAIDDEGSASGAPLSIERVLFAGNTAKATSGAVSLEAVGNATITDSTFSGNSAEENSGALSTHTAIPNTTVTLLNDTFVGNSASERSGGVFRNGSGQTIRYRNTVFADNGVAGTENTCETGGGAHDISEGHNFLDVTDSECALSAPGDQTGVAVKLGTLGNHGGPTDTILPLPGSPLIDGGDNTNCPLVDQRGLARPFGAACDVGAVEITPPAATTGATTSITSSSGVLNGVVSSRGLGGSTWHFEWGPSATYGNQTPGGTTVGLGPEGVADALSGLSAASTIHYRLVVSDSDGTSFGADQVFTTSAPPVPLAPTLTSLSQSARRWVEGRALAHLTRRSRPPTGTTFGFTLNVSATVNFKFTQSTTGRKVGKRCVASTSKNRRKARCARMVAAGALSESAHAGANKLSFQGLLSSSKKLKPGSYTVVVTASNAAGGSLPQKLRFVIVKK